MLPNHYKEESKEMMLEECPVLDCDNLPEELVGHVNELILKLENGELQDALSTMTLIKKHLSNEDLYETKMPIDLAFEYRNYLKMNAYCD